VDPLCVLWYGQKTASRQLNGGFTGGMQIVRTDPNDTR